MNSKTSFFHTMIRIALLYSFLLCAFTAVTVTVHAQLPPYTTLAPLPGTTENCTGNTCTTTFPKYLPGLFNFSIGLAALLAFVMISYGGFQYMTTDAIQGKEEGREKIENAIYGLLLVIGAYAILYTINPQILNFDLNIEKPALANLPNGVLVLTTLTGTDLANDTSLRTQLAGQGITVNKSACVGSNTSCTNVVGLPTGTISGLATLANTLGCSAGQTGCLVITGGTEGGHQTHGVGDPIVDLSPTASLNQYLGKTNPAEADTVTKTINGRTVIFKYEALGGNVGGTSTGAHWHTVFQ